MNESVIDEFELLVLLDSTEEEQSIDSERELLIGKEKKEENG